MMAQLGFCSMMSLISCFWPQFPFVDKGGLHLLKVSPIFPWPISNPRCPKSGAASGVRLSLGLADTRGPGNSPGNLGGGVSAEKLVVGDKISRTSQTSPPKQGDYETRFRERPLGISLWDGVAKLGQASGSEPAGPQLFLSCLGGVD